MRSGVSITAFFPCYNDAGTIASMVLLANRTLREIADDYEILVIDDGSTDHSHLVLEELVKSASLPLRVIHHPRNLGYGGALRSGFDHATKEWVFYTDGDAQYDVTELRTLAGQAGSDVDVVQGYKLARRDPWHRVALGAVYRRTARVLFNLQIRDVDCDFRLMRRALLQRLRLEHDSGVVCLELVRKLQDAGARFVEVPVRHYPRAYGRSQFFTPRRVGEVGVHILGLWWRLVVRRRAAPARGWPT